MSEVRGLAKHERTRASITEMSCSRQNAVAEAEALLPWTIDLWIQTRETPASGHCRTMDSVTSGRVTMTTPSTPPGIDFRSG
jgi:DNA-binding transcriptional regulator YdaS (Cro superfamily)